MANDTIRSSGLLSRGWAMVGRNKRYIFWFYLLNLTLAQFGASAFREHAHDILDHSLYADRLLHGFDLVAFFEMIYRPEMGPFAASRGPALFFCIVFFFAAALFIPGVLHGYGSTYRLPREDFFRACGRNLWRFIRLLILLAIVAGIAAGLLFWAQGALLKKVGESTNELLPVYTHVASLTVIFLIMTCIRIWFDLAQTDIVLSDQRAVRKSIFGVGFRHTRHGFSRLLGSYVAITVFGALILIAGIWSWLAFVPSGSILGAFLISQATLLLLLIPRFWQRAVAVAYYEENSAPVVVVQPIMPEPAVAVEHEPLIPPLIPPTPIAPQET